MKIKNKYTILIGVSVATLAPVAVVVSCSSKGWEYERGEGYDISFIKKNFGGNKNEHKNIMSSYMNATDMLVALGHYPDYSSEKTSGILYPDYLKPILGDNSASNIGGKYSIKKAAKIMNGKVIDRESIVNQDISTILLNEWERIDESKFTDVVPAMIYTSMADGYARYKDENYYGHQWNESWGLNTYEAFNMFAKGLDRAYPGNNFFDEAQKINKQVKDNVAALRTAVAANGKTITVVEVEKNRAGEIVPTQIRSGGVYNILYSQTRGLNYSFPRAKNPGNIKVNGFGLKAIDTVSLITEFTGSSDEIIVLNNPHGNDYADINAGAREAVKALLKTPNEATSRIKILDRDLFYDTVWGIYGLNEFLKNFKSEYNITATLKAIPEFSATTKLTKLR